MFEHTLDLTLNGTCSSTHVAIRYMGKCAKTNIMIEDRQYKLAWVRYSAQVSSKSWGIRMGATMLSFLNGDQRWPRLDCVVSMMRWSSA